MYFDNGRGMTLVRGLIAQACCSSGGNFADAAGARAFAEKRWGAGSETARHIKAAVGGGSTGAADWSALVGSAELQTEFLEAVQPLTVLDRMQGLRRVPPYVPVVSAADAAVAYWVGQGRAARVSSRAFDRTSLAPLKIVGLVVMSRELVQSADPRAEASIRGDLIKAAAALSDRSFLDVANAGVATVSPASITNASTSIASTGNVLDDLAAAVAAFQGDFSTACWTMSPTTAVQIGLIVNGRGLGDLGLRGGQLLGLPAYVSSATPSDSDGSSIALIDAARILFLDEGIEVSNSGQATIEMDDEPTGDTVTPTAATAHRVSMFQTESVAFKIVRRINWSAVSGSVVVITGAAYSS